MIKYVIQLFSTVIFTMLGSQAISQVNPTDFNIGRSLPTSPEAAMFSKFGEIPIGYYTGTAGVSIPLYTIKEGGLEIPIELKYHGAGNKVEDQASNVGLGWSLEPGGSIVMIVNGKLDSTETLSTSDYTYLKNGYTGYTVQTSRSAIGNNVYPCPSDTTTGDLPGTVFWLQQGDGQPDIYQYDFPGGYSGKFYINPGTGNIVLINKSADIVFSKVNATTFTALVLNGTKYTFAAVESSYSLPSGPRDFIGRTWKLTQILLPNKKTIRFTYSKGYSEWFTYSNSYHSAYPLDIPNTDYSFRNTGTSYQHIKYLDSIITTEAVIKFHMEDRDDLFGGSDLDGISDNGSKSVKRVKSIEIKDRVLGKKIKTFNLGYTYFDHTTSGGNYTSEGTYSLTWSLYDNQAILGKRLKLLSVQESGFTSGDTPVSLPAYQLEYDESVTMPLKTSFARDYWGYYNGKMYNSTMMPDFTTGRLTFASLPSEDTDALESYPFGVADREVDTTYTGAYLLKKIIYPTGGYTQFEYQIHHYATSHFGSYSSDHYGAGMRIAKIKNYSASGVLSSSKKIKYLLANNNPSGLSLSPLTFFYSSIGNMYFETFNTGITPYSKIIWYYSSENTTPYSGVTIGYSRVIEEDEVSNGRKVFTYHNQASKVKPHLPDVPDLYNGKMLKEEVYNSANTLLRETNYTFKNIESNSYTGVKLRTHFYIYHSQCTEIYRPTYPENGYIFEFYPILSEWIVLDTVVSKNYDGATLIANTSVNDYNSKGQRIEERSQDSKSLAKKVTYLYPIDASGTTATMLRDSSLFDNLLEVKSFVNSSEVARTTLDYRIEDSQVVQTGVVHSNDAGTTTYSSVDFDDYGPKQSLLQFTKDGLKTALIWTDQHTIPIAEVKNATSANVAYSSFEGNDSGNWTMYSAGLSSAYSHSGGKSYFMNNTFSLSKGGLSSGTTYIISYWTKNGSAYSVGGTGVEIATFGDWKCFEHEVTGSTSYTISGPSYIDDVRLYPKGALMTTYTHAPLIGLSSQTDAKGQSTFYEYDDNRRLKHIRDQQGNIVKSFDYNYAH